MAAFNLPSIAKLTMTDELHLQELGERKIALFCCIPDSDKSLNYLVGMIYTQLIQTLYRQADRIHKGRLPVPVHCLMDEYANISLPKDTFLSALATMRSRAIFCSIIVQNMAQLKAMYKDDWESLVGLCDEFLYLGGTEKETHKYVSELLGKETISTTSYNQSKGRSGSYSINHQQSGRDLMTPDEVRRMKRSDCLVMISGEAPVRDKKYNLFDHPNLKYTPDYRSPRGLLHRFATPIPAPEGYTMPPDYMAQAGTVSLAYVAELTCPEITEDLYDELQEWEESLL